MTNYFDYADKVDLTNNPYAMDDVAGGKKGKNPPGTGNQSLEFSLGEDDKFFIFRNVLVDGINYDISWTKNFLANNEAKTQDDWQDYCKTQTEYPGRIIRIPSGLVFHACVSNLHANNTNSKLDADLIETVRQYFAQSFTQGTLMTTSTKIKYNARSTLDEVIHDYKSANP